MVVRHREFPQLTNKELTLKVNNKDNLLVADIQT
jgi:hypothetical protein